jgi:hypothetical protein
MEDFNSKYSGEQVEALLDQVASGNAGGGGGGGIAVETDPIFSASPAATITDNDKAVWSGKQDAISDLDTIRSGAAKGATSVQPDDIEDFVKSSELADVAWTADYNELENKPTFKTINGESIVGSGDIAIAGGSGEKGDKGDTGVGVQSVKQTTTSNVDSGYNVVTVTLTDGTTSTFSVKNGSKGSTGANGTNGVSVSSVKQTTISSADGGTNVVTVTLSNGTTSTFNVKNGSKGSNGTNGKDGADGDDGATFTPSVDSAGNLSWSNNKGLANPPTVNIKGPKGDAGSGGGGKELILNQGAVFDDANPMRPNKIYINSTSYFAINIAAFQEVSDYDEYCIIFKYPEGGFYIPQNVKFANGQIPTIEYDTECELSVVGIGSGANRTYHAVLTPFKTL